MRNFAIEKGQYLTHHLFQFAYTLVIVASTAILTSVIITSKFTPISLVTKLVKPNTTAVVDEPQYTESGSPLDNREIDPNAKNKVIFHGPRDAKKIALTFDAEMTEGMKANVVSGKVSGSYDKRIINTLNQTKTPATLFLTGMWIEMYPDVTSELSANPLFELGSHSYTDSSYSGSCYGLGQLPDTVKIEDIGATEKLLREHGHIDNRLFRFPGGCYSQHDVDLVAQANDLVVHWDVKANDGFNQNTNQIVHNVVDYVQNGSIVVLHMNGIPTAPKTAEALPQIISTLKSRGFEFVKVNELLGLPAEPKQK